MASKLGQRARDLDEFLATVDPSLPALSHDLDVAPDVLNAYADAAPDLIKIVDNATRVSQTIVEEQQNLDALLISAIGLADIGNDVVGSNRQALTDVLHLLVPTTDLTNQYHEALTCALAGIIPLATSPPLPVPVSSCRSVSRSAWNDTDTRTTCRRSRRRAVRTCLDLPNVPFGGASAVRRHRRRRQPSAVRKPGHTAELRWPQAVAVRADRRAASQHRTDRAARMTGARRTVIKFGIFAVVMAVLTVFLFVVFGQYRTGSTNGYSAVFADASRLKAGDSVRVAGIRVGTVNSVSLRPDKTVLVKFDADRDIVLTTGTKAAVRYLNLVGDRYLELVDGPGSTEDPPPGSQIPVDRTAPALDLDLLLGGLKPVIQGLNPQDVNALTASLLQIFQGQGGTLESLLSKTSSFSNALADNNQVIEQLIDNLNTVVATLAKDGDKFSRHGRPPRAAGHRAVGRPGSDRRRHRVARQRHRVVRRPADQSAPAAGRHGGPAESGCAALLIRTRTASTPQLQKAPENYRKLVRLGAYGSFVNYYICGIRSGSPIFRAAPRSSPGSSKKAGGARNPDA